eukprot:GHVP01031543.1.p1 GENE.GHVP01031543.1~~GHVP01031543.1.p1  ORF type:complete len:406 (+),score=87.75 GHVP01031543.1:2000-3217(+)
MEDPYYQWCETDKSEVISIMKKKGVKMLFYNQSDEEKSVAGMIRTNKPIDLASVFFYYEIKVHSRGISGNVAIGLSGRDVGLNRLPGWEPDSYGYHGDDGMVFGFDGGKETEYSTTFTEGDTIGCGICLLTNEVFFTKNSVYLGVAGKITIPENGIYAAIGMKTAGECVSASFNQNAFLFDLSTMINKTKSRELLQKIPKDNSIEKGDLLIKKYLIMNGYHETLRAMAEEETISPEDIKTAHSKRKTIDLILNGDMEGAIKHLNKTNQCTDDIEFMLKKQKLIEMIREYYIDERKEEEKTLKLKEIFDYGKILNKKHKKELVSVFSILTYENPFESDAKDILNIGNRVVLAKDIGNMVSSLDKKDSFSTIEGKVENLRKTRELLKKNGESKWIFADWVECEEDVL